MSEDRRDEFLKRLSTVGFGPRESLQVLLGNIVYDVREQVVHKRFRDDEMDRVVRFHDAAEALWRDTMKSDPPLLSADVLERVQTLRALCVDPLSQYVRKLEHGIRHAEELVKAHARR